MARHLIVSGGVGHAFDETSAILAELAGEEGLESEVTTDVGGALAALSSERVDLVTVNALRWRMLPDRYAPQRDDWAYEIPAAARRGVQAHVGRGGGVLGVHTAAICFDDWPEWGAILGGWWDWDRSAHPPLGPVHIDVVDPGDDLVAGFEAFDSIDEVYGHLAVAPGIAPLLSGTHGGVAHPLLWRHRVGAARVVYDALGHDARAYEPPAHRSIVRRAVRWASTGG